MDRSSTGTPLMTIETLGTDFTLYSAELQTVLTSVGLDGQSAPTIENFPDCYNSILAHSQSSFFGTLSPESQTRFNEFITKVWDFLNDIEESYDCGGFCYEPLFGLTTDVASGRPTKECLGVVIESTFQASLAISGVGAAVMFITFFLSLGICCAKPTSIGKK